MPSACLTTCGNSARVSSYRLSRNATPASHPFDEEERALVGVRLEGRRRADRPSRNSREFGPHVIAYRDPVPVSYLNSSGANSAKFLRQTIHVCLPGVSK
jgi:hypothetical protein